jgi:hypothetical protein
VIVVGGVRSIRTHHCMRLLIVILYSGPLDGLMVHYILVREDGPSSIRILDIRAHRPADLNIPVALPSALSSSPLNSSFPRSLNLYH